MLSGTKSSILLKVYCKLKLKQSNIELVIFQNPTKTVTFYYETNTCNTKKNPIEYVNFVHN